MQSWMTAITGALNTTSRAKFRYLANVEQTHFNIDGNLDKNLFMRLAECTYIDRGENI